MKYEDFLQVIVQESLIAARDSYSDSPDRLSGAESGLRACLGKSPDELKMVLKQAQEMSKEARFDRSDNYWEVRCYEIEVEWVCDCISAILVKNGREPILGKPTKRGIMNADRVMRVCA